MGHGRWWWDARKCPPLETAQAPGYLKTILSPNDSTTRALRFTFIGGSPPLEPAVLPMSTSASRRPFVPLFLLITPPTLPLFRPQLSQFSFIFFSLPVSFSSFLFSSSYIFDTSQHLVPRHPNFVFRKTHFTCSGLFVFEKQLGTR